MLFQITKIEFDFDYEDLTQEEMNDIVNETKRGYWTSLTEEKLIDAITHNTGWCIKSIDYLNVLN